jgi:hypothetical protein
MRPQVAIGIGIAAAALFGVLLVPRFVPASVDRAEAEALRRSEQARRQLHEFSFRLGEVARLADAEKLKAADLSALAGSEELSRLEQSLNELVRRTQQADQTLHGRGLPATTIRAQRVDSAGLQSAAGVLHAATQRNQALLKQALDEARAAARSGGEVGAVAMVLGMTELARAEELSQAAQRTRSELASELASFLEHVYELQHMQTETEQVSAFDVQQVLASLAEDTEEVNGRLKEAEGQVAELTKRVPEFQARLQQARSELAALRAALIELEKRGFRPGDDSSFEAFRAEYQRIAARMAELEQQEQLLSVGGMQGGELQGDELEHGQWVAGQPSEGLDQVEWNLARAADNAARWARARDSLQQLAARIQRDRQEADQRRQAYAAQAQSLRSRLEQHRARMKELLDAQMAQENEALGAARAAEEAFAKAGKALAGWKSAARKLRSEQDTKGTNERLRVMVGDETVERIGPAAQAEARVLAGHVYAQRVQSLGDYVLALERAERIATELTPDAQERDRCAGELDRAKREGAEKLHQAIATYEPWAQAQTPTNWVSQASLAYAYSLLARVQPEGAEPARAQMLKWLSQAVTRRERSPYLADHVTVYRAISGEDGGRHPTPEEDGEPAESAPEG